MWHHTKTEINQIDFKAFTTGKSKTERTYFELKSGVRIFADCINWEENFGIENNYTDNFSLAIYPKEILNWFYDE